MEEVEVTLPGDGPVDGAAVARPPAEGQGEGGAGAQAEGQTRGDRRFAQMTGKLSLAEQAAARERARAEAAEREREELRRQLQMATETGFGFATRSTEQALKGAKAAYARAYESGDPNAMSDAADALADARHRMNLLERDRPQQRPEPRQDQQQPVQQRQAQPQGPSPQAQAWMVENPWFMADEGKRTKALTVHDQLIRRGYVGDSEAYYEALTARTRDLADPTGDGGDDGEGEPNPRPAPRAMPAGAATTRTIVPPKPYAGGRVRLTGEQVQAARVLGISNEEYAAGLVEEARAGRSA